MRSLIFSIFIAFTLLVSQTFSAHVKVSNCTSSAPLAAAVAAASADDTIELICPSGAVMYFSSSIFVTKNLELIGGGVTLDGQDRTRFFVVGTKGEWGTFGSGKTQNFSCLSLASSSNRCQLLNPELDHAKWFRLQ